jgi:outer membrane protein TolC
MQTLTFLILTHLKPKNSLSTTNTPAMKVLYAAKKHIAKYVFLFSTFLLACFISNAQLKRDTAKRTSADTSTLIEEKLVELAMKGPAVQAALHQYKINEYQLKAARNNWVNLLTVSYNYNDQSFKNNTQTNVVYPKFFVGVTVPLGTLLSRTQVRAAQEGLEISRDNQEQLRRAVRSEVIGKYKQYKAFGELISLQSALLNDVQALLLQSEDKFSKGTITMEVYNNAQRIKNDESTKLINLQLQQDLVKLDIERMIGTSLESVIKK